MCIVQILDFVISCTVAGMLKVYRCLTPETVTASTPDTNIINNFTNLFAKNLIVHTSTIETEIRVWFFCLRFRQRSIERAMDLTDSFTWEDLPTRDADTGHLTAAGWIPLTMKYNRNAAIAILCVHFIQSTMRIMTNHETIIIVWYPFDWTVSPIYELVNISQVTLYKTEF